MLAKQVQVQCSGVLRQGIGYGDRSDMGSEGNEESRDIVVPFFLGID